jgi:hypothetical protein
MKKDKTTLVDDQLHGQIVDGINQTRHNSENIQQNLQDDAFYKAQNELDNAYNFCTNENHILGSMQTKHGECAEHLNVGIHNARQAVDQQDMTATFDGIDRTAPTDYIVDGIHIQSKFCNNSNADLNHLLEHMHKYEYYGRDGLTAYEIPADHYENIIKVINGENTPDLSHALQDKIREKVATIESTTGHSFEEVVFSSNITYADAQLENIPITLDREHEYILNKNIDNKHSISENHQANFAEGTTACASSAAVGAAISITRIIWQKHKTGKNIFRGDFTKEDWRDLGIDTVKSAAVGGVSGIAIYAITNYTGLAAPFAAAVVTATKGVTSLISDYRKGDISDKEFYTNAMIICSESALVAITAAVGQAIIPVPILGAVIGSIAGQMLTQLIKDKISIAKYLQEDMSLFMQKINKQQIEIIMQIEKKFQALGDLTKAAFDTTNNKRMVAASIQLARYYQVPEDEIIKTDNELYKSLGWV